MLRILENLLYISFFISLIIFGTGVVGILFPIATKKKELNEEIEMWWNCFKYGGISTLIFLVIIF